VAGRAVAPVFSDLFPVEFERKRKGREVRTALRSEYISYWRENANERIAKIVEKLNECPAASFSKQQKDNVCYLSPSTFFLTSVYNRFLDPPKLYLWWCAFKFKKIYFQRTGPFLLLRVRYIHPCHTLLNPLILSQLLRTLAGLGTTLDMQQNYYFINWPLNLKPSRSWTQKEVSFLHCCPPVLVSQQTEVSPSWLLVSLSKNLAIPLYVKSFL